MRPRIRRSAKSSVQIICIGFQADGSPPPVTLDMALLFVCGLERRFLYDLSDREVVVAEVLRLLSACSFPRLVTAHLERFLAFSLACHGIESHDDRLSTSVIERLASATSRTHCPS